MRGRRVHSMHGGTGLSPIQAQPAAGHASWSGRRAARLADEASQAHVAGRRRRRRRGAQLVRGKQVRDARRRLALAAQRGLCLAARAVLQPARQQPAPAQRGQARRAALAAAASPRAVAVLAGTLFADPAGVVVRVAGGIPLASAPLCAYLHLALLLGAVPGGVAVHVLRSRTAAVAAGRPTLAGAGALQVLLGAARIPFLSRGPLAGGRTRRARAAAARLNVAVRLKGVASSGADVGGPQRAPGPGLLDALARDVREQHVQQLPGPALVPHHRLLGLPRRHPARLSRCPQYLVHPGGSREQGTPHSWGAHLSSHVRWAGRRSAQGDQTAADCWQMLKGAT